MRDDAYKLLVKRLDEFIRKYYTNQIIKGTLYFLAIGLGAFLLIALLEYFGRFSSSVRTILFFLLVALGIGLLIRYIVLPLVKLFKLGKVISHEEASQIIGKHFPNVDDKLLNTLQLHNQVSKIEGDTSLMLASIEQRIRELNPVPFSSAIDYSENKKYLKYAMLPIAVILLLIFAAPNILTDSTKRLVAHSQEFSPVAPFEFVIMNEKLEAPTNSSFTLRVMFEGEVVPENASILLNNNSFRLKKTSKNEFDYTFKNIRQDINFQLIADGFYSDRYTLQALAAPVLLNFDIALNYPRYTGKKNEVISNSGNITVPEGSTAEWNFKTENTDGVRITLSDTVVNLSEDTRDKFRFSHRLISNESYLVNTFNENVKSSDTLEYRIQVVKDSYPTIEVNETKDSLNNRRIYFDGIVGDDYGTSALYFHYKLTTANADSAEIQAEKIPISISGSLKEQFFYFWDLDRLKLNAGDQINYYFEVWDNDGVNGSKSARSKTNTFKAPTLNELDQQEELASKSIKENIDQSIKEASDLQKKIEELNKELLQKKELNWQDKKRLQDLIEQQKQLEKNIQNIQDHNKQNKQEQSQYKQMSESLMEKQMQLEKMFDELMSDEMKEMFRKLEEMMEELNKDQLREEMEKIDFNAKELEKELDRSLEIFKQMEFEKEFQEAIDKLDKLAEEQKELAEKTEKESGKDSEKQKELEEKQEEIKDKFEQVKDDLKKLNELNKELEQPNEMPDTEQQQKQAEEEMEKASEEMQEQKNKKAAESQKKAGEKMEEMAQSMQSSMDSQSAESAAEDMDAIRALLENIIQLSFDQEEVMESLKTVRRDDPQYVALGQRQKKIQDDSKMVEDSLFALSKRVPQIESLVNREIGLVNQNIEKAIADMGERMTSDANSRQQYAMTSYNNLALLLDEALQQMQMQMASKMPGKGNCEKPGGMGQNPSTGKMSQMQEQMSKKLDQMQKALEKGNSPGKQNQGGNGGQEMSKEIAKMAAEQGAIRREIEKMAQELNQRGKGEGKGLEKLAEEMEKIEKDLVNKQVTRETLKRQEEIMVRLLESEKAEREREYEEKRQSNEAQNLEKSNPEEYLEYKKRKEREVELLRTVPADLKPYYRNRVNDYFIKFDE